MASVVSRESYFEAGLDVLSDLGYGGLKLAEVCNRLGVTTGSFYHYFPAGRPTPESWSRTGCRPARSGRRGGPGRAGPAPPHRHAHPGGLTLPHGAEARDPGVEFDRPEVYAVQAAVDQQRFDIMYESAFEILRNKRQAQLFAAWGVYLLVGYEQATLPRETTAARVDRRPTARCATPARRCQTVTSATAAHRGWLAPWVKILAH